MTTHLSVERRCIADNVGYDVVGDRQMTGKPSGWLTVNSDLLALLPSVPDHRRAGDVADLGRHVLLDERAQICSVVRRGCRIPSRSSGRTTRFSDGKSSDRAQPVLDRFRAFVRRRFSGSTLLCALHCSLHTTAAVMTADDDVRDSEHVHCVGERSQGRGVLWVEGVCNVPLMEIGTVV